MTGLLNPKSEFPLLEIKQTLSKINNANDIMTKIQNKTDKTILTTLNYTYLSLYCIDNEDQVHKTLCKKKIISEDKKKSLDLFKLN